MTSSMNTWLNLSAEFLLKAASAQSQIRRARQDPAEFAEFAFADETGGRMRLADMHRELQAFLNDGPRALVELPRDHGKTVQVLIRIVWELGRNPNLRALLASGSAALAVQRGRFLRDAIADNPGCGWSFRTWCPTAPGGSARSASAGRAARSVRRWWCWGSTAAPPGRAEWDIVSLNEAAADVFSQLRRQKIRVGSQELKIAANAIAENALLLSANLRDLQKVPGLRVENWLLE